MGFAKKKAAKADSAPAPTSEPVAEKPKVEITDAERLAHIYRTMPVTEQGVDAQLLADTWWVQRKQLQALLSELAEQSGRYYAGVGGNEPLRETRDRIVALFKEVAGKP